MGGILLKEDGKAIHLLAKLAILRESPELKMELVLEVKALEESNLSTDALL